MFYSSTGVSHILIIIHNFCLAVSAYIFELLVEGCVVLLESFCGLQGWGDGWRRRWGDAGQTCSSHGGEVLPLESLQGRQAGLLGQDVLGVLTPVIVVVVPGQAELLHPLTVSLTLSDSSVLPV